VTETDRPLQELTERFFQFETEQSLFEARIDGAPIWERIRFQVHRRLLQERGLIGQAHGHFDLSYFHGARRIVENAVRRNPFLASPCDVLVYGHERRKQLADGQWWDLYCDPLTSELDLSYVHLEQPHNGEHRRPAKTENLRYVDLIQYGGGVFNLLTPDSWTVSSKELGPFEAAEQTLRDEFGVDVDVADLAAGQALVRAMRLPLWRRLIRRLDPEIAVVLVGYMRETFVEACQTEGVPVVELQHGVVYPEHVGYAYPTAEPSVFPDYFLTFGEFWNDAAPYPLPPERIRSVGYPYIERRTMELDDIDATGEVAFISQGTIGADLSRVAVETAERLDRDVVYKLHPGERDRWKRDYPWLSGSEVRVVDGSDVALYDLFERVPDVVGVNSTALYEALAFGVKVYVLPFAGACAMDQLVSVGGARRTDDVDKLVETLGARSETDPEVLDRLFETGAVSNFECVVKEIVGDKPSN
jgi:hypothetical protein